MCQEAIQTSVGGMLITSCHSDVDKSSHSVRRITIGEKENVELPFFRDIRLVLPKNPDPPDPRVVHCEVWPLGEAQHVFDVACSMFW